MFIIIRDNKIKYRFIGPEDKIKDIYPDILDSDIIENVPDSFDGNIGMDMRNFDSNFNLLPISERFISGLVELRSHEIIDGESIRAKTIDEMESTGVISHKQRIDAENFAIDALRQTAYTNESDPLFFKYQRGECSKDEWLAKIEEIKIRLPKKE